MWQNAKRFLINNNPGNLRRARIREEYKKLVDAFCEKADGMGYPELRHYLWYHAVDLQNGLVTPGMFDYRADLHKFGFPDNMKNMRVLDVGSATGFFAFEFEKRGAEVVSVELPSFFDWDIAPIKKIRDDMEKGLMKEHNVSTPKEGTYCHLHGPFDFCSRVLDSKVKRCYSTIYDLNEEKLGNEGFDIVFLGDILLHVFSPLDAIVSVARFCRGTMVILQPDPAIWTRLPVMVFAGTRSGRTWWLPSRKCFERMLHVAGFGNIEVMAKLKNLTRLTGETLTQMVIHAKMEK